ncbi:MAG: restriction endonuclease subunit S, partial [Clostridia bacterium]|nr:restriction endonuclease subunit S [Clostridia bacterium]
MAKFTDIFEDVTKQGTKIPSNLYLENGIYPIIDQGQSQIAGYTNETKGLFTDIPAIIFGDHTRIIKYVDVPCFLGADGVKLLKTKDKNANYKYLYYALYSADIPNTGYNRHYKWLKEIDIPEYSIEEQCSIVDQLEKIDALIFLRKQQIKKLDELVKSRFIELFGDYKINDKGFECKKGSDLFRFSSGKFLPEEKRHGDGIPVYGGNGIAWYT